MDYHIKDPKLVSQGRLRVEWAAHHMPVLGLIGKRFSKDQSLKGIRVAACLHVTTETANLMRVLKAGGAKISLCASNPLSTQDDVASYLAKDLEISVFAVKGEDNKTYYDHINRVLDAKPEITMDDGADLVSTLHSERKSDAQRVLGGTEETTTGVIRLKSLAAQGELIFPIVAVNDAQTKHLFDNRYGTGQSTIDGILRATNILLAGKTLVVSGYGMCGRGVAKRAQGMGSNVVVTEVEPLRALEAFMDGYRVMPAKKAAQIGDIFVTVTGDIHALAKEHFKAMKDGAILANSGHFDVEIDIPALKGLAKSTRRVRDFVDEYTLEDGKRIYLLAEGRLVNLAAAEGHPAAVMDMSFANQALSADFIKKNSTVLEKKVYKVPLEIDEQIAELKLNSMGIEIDKLSKEQKNYLASWEIGT